MKHGKLYSNKDRLTVWCNNIECPYNKKLEEPKNFGFNRTYYVPFEDDVILGKCIKLGYNFLSINWSDKDINSKFAICDILYKDDVTLCDRTDCAHNDRGLCTRKEIWVKRTPGFVNDLYWECRCFSNEKISGHRDWSNLLNPDRTAKGGSIDDKTAERMHQDSLKYKSFGTWHKDSKEQVRKNRTQHK